MLKIHDYCFPKCFFTVLETISQYLRNSFASEYTYAYNKVYINSNIRVIIKRLHLPTKENKLIIY